MFKKQTLNVHLKIPEFSHKQLWLQRHDVRLHLMGLCPFAASASSAGGRGGFGSHLKVHLRYICGPDNDGDGDGAGDDDDDDGDGDGDDDQKYEK